MDGWNSIVSFWDGPFSGAFVVSFRDGKFLFFKNLPGENQGLEVTKSKGFV